MPVSEGRRGRCRLTIEQSARPANAAPLRGAVVALAADLGMDGSQLENVALAIAEAVANVVMHAYHGAPEPGSIRVDAYPEDGHLVVIVTDHGRGMLPRPDSPGLGLGLPLMSRLTDSLHIDDHHAGDTDEPGVSVRMCFALPSAG